MFDPAAGRVTRVSLAHCSLALVRGDSAVCIGSKSGIFRASNPSSVVIERRERRIPWLKPGVCSPTRCHSSTVVSVRYDVDQESSGTLQAVA